MVAQNKLPGTLLDAMRYFDADTARRYVESIKWPSGPCCPHCGSTNVGYISTRQRYQCRDCRKQSGLFSGTIFEGTHLRLDQWVAGVWMIANCRNGVSSCELARTIGCKQTSAWHLLHRIRRLFQQVNDGPMMGVVQVDEAYIGGLVKFMHAKQRERALARENTHKGKTIVFGMLEVSSGRVRARVINAASLKHSRENISENVQPGSEIHTDSSRIYDWTAEQYVHRTVNHRLGEYVKDGVTTNALEGFFNCLRRGLKGTYIRATPEHLAAYVDEQVWRFNVRKLTDWERFDRAMRMIVGKRLTYSELTDGAVR